jgi:hypothetical protein
MENAEADVFMIFEKIMNSFKHMEMFRPNYTGYFIIGIIFKEK